MKDRKTQGLHSHPYTCRVSDLINSEHELVARVLLPMQRDGEDVTWAHFIPRDQLSATVSWLDVCVALGKRPTMDYAPPFAQMTRLLNTALEGALTRILDVDEQCWWAVWEGYATTADLAAPGFDAAPPLLRTLPRNVVADLAFTPAGSLSDSAVLRHEPPAWLREPDGNPPGYAHYPLIVCSDSLSVVMACPAYHDSLYISGPEAMLTELTAADLEVFVIDPELPLPGSGKIFP